MKKSRRKDPLYIFILLAGILLLLSPVIQAVDYPGLVAGIPVSFIYVFGSWALLILLVALASRKLSSRNE